MEGFALPDLLHSLVTAFPSSSAEATEWPIAMAVTIDTVASGRPIFSQHFIRGDSGGKHGS
jgi:hypothetical protein